jgi:S1/P1 Nuclease
MNFVDGINDSPPSSCSVNYERDCTSGGCVVSAIANNSAILKQCISDQDTSKACSDSLKYIVHFFGDITQPLHCSALSRGGNEIQVKFGNRRRNLHSVRPL